MSELTPNLADEVVAACEANRAEVATALSRALGRQISIGETVESGIYTLDTSEELEAGGLAMLLRCGEKGVLALMPDSGGFLPAWARAPDATESIELNSVAREVGRLLIPQSIAIDESSALWLPSLTAALGRAGLTEGAAMVKLALASEGESSPLYLIWPATTLSDVAASEAKPGEPNPKLSPQGEESAKPLADAASPPRRHEYGDLPPYARHLLKIEVPVMVNLVSKKQTIQEIMELGPGAIVNFEKSCDDPLELVVGNRRVALGSAVKVGDKFGIEITEVCLPDESFVPVVPTRGRA